jgi:chromobox protein 1
LPLGSWEDYAKVNAVVQREDKSKKPDTVTSSLTGLLEWHSTGRKTEHAMEVLRQKCPQLLLDYYESHL